MNTRLLSCSASRPAASFAGGRRFLHVGAAACLAAALLLGAAACTSEGGDATGEGADTSGAFVEDAEETGRDTAAMPARGTASEASLDSTIALAESGLATVTPSAAVPLIQAWQQRLDEADNPALTSISEDLEQLKGELQASTIDGSAVGDILTRLGEKTTAAAESAADSSAAPQLGQLGTLLTEAGAQFAGAQQSSQQ